MQTEIHIPVFLNQAINGLNILEDGIYIDATFGHGGHSELILSKLGKKGKLIAIDRDPAAIKFSNKIQDNRFSIIHGCFSNLYKYVNELNLYGKVNGILFDLGVSSHQIDNAKRGFSFIKDGPLDMRMNPSTGYSAAHWLKNAKRKDIIYVLKNFGEEHFARRIAYAIVEYLKNKPIINTQTLAEIIKQAIPIKNKFKHPATRSFQAIRIHINNELKELTLVLKDIVKILQPQGRLVIISFHSLEDRIVKKFINNNSNNFCSLSKLPMTSAQIKQYHPINLKNLGKILATVDEISYNFKARSAILRIAEKIN